MTQRRWFQIHLSTAMVMMVVASGLLWLNLKRDLIESGPGSYTCGWPLKFYSTFRPSSQTRYLPVGLEARPVQWGNFAGNVLIALGITMSTGGVVEYLVFRRAKP